MESYFSQVKLNASGQLSSVNYATAQASVETTKAAGAKWLIEADYRDTGLDIHPVQLKKRKTKKWLFLGLCVQLIITCIITTIITCIYWLLIGYFE